MAKEQWRVELKEASRLDASKMFDRSKPFTVSFSKKTELQEVQHTEDIDTAFNQEFLKKEIKPDMVLYRLDFLGKTKYVTEEDQEFRYIIDNENFKCYQLKYYREYNGMTDVVICFKVGSLNLKTVSYYTFENEEFCRVSTLFNKEWKLDYNMINYVISLFAAFREHGITFINDSINDITDGYLKVRGIQSKQRKRSRRSVAQG